jgi:hypothetical protein
MFRGEVVDYAGTFWQRLDFNVAEKSCHGGHRGTQESSAGKPADTYRNQEAVPCTFLAAAINITGSSDSKFPDQGPYIS